VLVEKDLKGIDALTESYVEAVTLLAEGVNVLVGDTTVEALQAWVDKTTVFLGGVLAHHKGVEGMDDEATG